MPQKHKHFPQNHRLLGFPILIEANIFTTISGQPQKAAYFMMEWGGSRKSLTE
jgi:hypothetical protein